MTRPRLLFYDDAATFGGHELMTLRLVERLALRGEHEIVFIASAANAELRRRLGAVVPPIRVVSTPYESGRGQWLRSYLSIGPLLRLRRLIRAEQPALLIVVQGGIALSSLALLAGRLAGVRTLSYLPMTHDESLFAATPLRARVRQWLVRPYYELPDCLVTISPRMAGHAARRRRGEVCVVENGIDLPPADPVSGVALRADLGLGPDELLLLMVGRIEFWQKRHELAVEALGIARARGLRAHLLVVGSGPDEAELRAWVQVRGLGSVVHWRPWQADVGPFHAACDALLLPSRYEGVPLVLLEAMHAGRKVIASDVDGMADMLPPAWTFPSGDAAALAGRLCELADDAPDDAAHLARHRALVASEHTVDAFAQRFLRVIRAQLAAGMRVAVVEPVGGHGGMNLYDGALCRSLVKAGAEATLLTCDETSVSGQEGFPIDLCYRGIYGKRAGWVRGLRFLRGSLTGLTAARRAGARLAHFHFFHVGTLELFNVLLARLLGLRVVITAHDVEAFKAGLSVPAFVRWAYALSHRVIAHSRVAKDELVDELGLAPAKVDVILHGNYLQGLTAEPTREQARAHFGFAPGQRVLVFFGQIKDVKGLDVLLDGLALAREHDTHLHLLVGGRVWKTDFSRYAELIERRGLAPHCTLHVRYIPDAEVAFFYRCADLVVLPYRRIYQSGVVLEAMSHGSPVLVSDIPGMLEAVDDEATGFVFRTQDPAHLARRVAEVFAVPGLAAAIGQAGLRRVARRNDWSLLGEQVVACYRRAMHRST